MPSWSLCCESEAILILSKMYRPGYRAEARVWENSYSAYRDLRRKNRDDSNLANPASHMNTPYYLQRKDWRGEISET